MTKAEVYNAIIDMAKKTGQGVPSFIERKVGSDMIDELVEAGLIKRVKQSLDDPWLCLTKGYCVESDMENGNRKALVFVKYYLGIKDVYGGLVLKFGTPELKKGLTTEIEIFESDINNMKEYQEWYDKNKILLEETQNMQHIGEIVTVLDDDFKEFIKSRGWYTDNLTVKECISQINDANDNDSELIRLYESLVSIQERKSLLTNSQRTEVEETKKKLDVCKFNYKNRKKVLGLILKEKRDVSIQECLKNFLS